MSKQTNNLPAKKGKSEVLREVLERGTGGVPKKGGYYEVAPGKFEADAWRAQEEANEAEVKSKIVKAEQTDRYAEVIAEAETEGGIIVQGIVHHDYDTIMAKKIMEMYKKVLNGKQVFWGKKGERRRIDPFNDEKNPFMMSETGKMIPNLSGMGMAKILDDMLRFRDFSLRDATSKAMRIAQLKALNEEWRDRDEIEAEEDEVKSVNKGKDVKKVTQQDVDKKTLKSEYSGAEQANMEEKVSEGKSFEEAANEVMKAREDEENAGEEEKGDVEEEAQEQEVQETESEEENTEQEGEKTPKTELLDDTDELTKAELHEMTAEEIGLWAVKQLQAAEKDVTGAEIGKILMPYNRKRYLSTRKFNQVKNWFMDQYMTG